MGSQNNERCFVEHILELLELLQANQTGVSQFMDLGPEAFSLPDTPSVRAAYDIMRFMDEMPGGFLIYHASEGEEIIYANKALLRMFQCNTMAEFRAHTGNSFRGMVHPEDLEEVEKSIWEQIALSQYDLDYVEYRIIRRDGAVRWIEDYGHFVRSKTAGDTFYVFLGDATDKKNRRQQERARREEKLQALIQEYDRERSLINQEHLRRLEVIEGLSADYESILFADLDGDRIFPYRLSSRTQLEFSEDCPAQSYSQYISEYVRRWVHPEDQERVGQAASPDFVRQELGAAGSFYINYRALESGQAQYLQLRFVTVGGREGAAQVVLGCRRVDEEVRHEMEQKQLMADALHDANLAIVAKNTFLSNMSHDMRTPLNAIFGFTALAKKGLPEGSALRAYLDKVDASSRQLLDLIDKVLDIAWSESRESHPAEEECDLAGIVEEVYEFLVPHAAEKDIAFTLDCSRLEHRHIFSDEAKLKQLVLYLANNAVTYTKTGGEVSISVEEQDFRPNHYARYRITVADTGVGISREFLSQIFEPFSREKNTTLSGIHGTGLGLTIAKSIVDTLGGVIAADSNLGQGSTFTVTFHFRVRQDSIPAAGTAAALRQTGRKILLVEDNEINQEIETELLEELGFTIETAADGKIAVEMVERAKPGDYGLILMDIQMPFMDGWQAARTIRKLENPALAGIPIIALSANVFDSDVRTSMECGMDAHLAKPIDIPLLLKTMEEVQRRRFPRF